jgi:hypothetical protein
MMVSRSRNADNIIGFDRGREGVPMPAVGDQRVADGAGVEAPSALRRPEDEDYACVFPCRGVFCGHARTRSAFRLNGLDALGAVSFRKLKAVVGISANHGFAGRARGEGGNGGRSPSQRRPVDSVPRRGVRGHRSRQSDRTPASHGAGLLGADLGALFGGARLA